MNTLKIIIRSFKKTNPQFLSWRFNILHGALRTVISLRLQGPTISPITSVEEKKRFHKYKKQNLKTIIYLLVKSHTYKHLFITILRKQIIKRYTIKTKWIVWNLLAILLKVCWPSEKYLERMWCSSVIPEIRRQLKIHQNTTLSFSQIIFELGYQFSSNASLYTISLLVHDRTIIKII